MLSLKLPSALAPVDIADLFRWDKTSDFSRHSTELNKRNISRKTAMTTGASLHFLVAQRVYRVRHFLGDFSLAVRAVSLRPLGFYFCRLAISENVQIINLLST